MMRLAPLALLLALGGCASSTPTRFWTIEPVAAPAARQAGCPRESARLRIDAVHVPLAIDRLEVVQHDAQNRVTVDDFDRWSAPPGDLIQRALTQDLASRLPPGSVTFPASPKPPGAIGIVVDILDLRQTGDGYAMTVSWSSVGPTTTSLPLRRQLDLQTPGGEDVASQTEALDRLVGELAESITQAVAVPHA